MLTLDTHTLERPIAVTSPSPTASSIVRRLSAAVAGLFALRMSGAPVSTRLYYLNDHMMRDIGVSRPEIGHGPVESFWRE